MVKGRGPVDTDEVAGAVADGEVALPRPVLRLVDDLGARPRCRLMARWSKLLGSTMEAIDA
jgi:hypothetical protein